MNKKTDVSQYYELEANIEKKSTNFFLGYQPKVWKILENGTKIAYRNPNEQFLPHKTFSLAEIKTEETNQENQFEFITSDRVYELRAKTVEESKLWQRAICMLKKDLKRKKNRKKSPVHSRQYKTPYKHHNDSTLPSIGPHRPTTLTPPILKESEHFKEQDEQVLNKTAPMRNTNQNNVSHTELSFSFLNADQEELKIKFQEHFKNLTPDYLQYHVFIAKIKTKVQELLTSKVTKNLYVIFSSKSLSPEEHISDENLSSAYLPHWADVDCLYRIIEGNASPKLVFELVNLNQIQDDQNPRVLKVTTQTEAWEFQFQTPEDQGNFRQILKTAYNNALEVKNNVSRKNYDALIQLHSRDQDSAQFTSKIREMTEPLMPQGHQYEPWVIKKFTDNLNPLLNEVLTIFQKKVNSHQQKVRSTTIDFVKVIHEQVKFTLKLVWDSSHTKCKGLDILHMLKAISTYESLVNKYVIKDKQIYQAQKQLSKIYVRTLYKNFEKIIINIVSKQKTQNYFIVEEEDEDCYAQTHSIIDLFKFLYDFFNLAIPCWNDKLHLHNIHKLTRKTLGVFISEMKSMIDEEEISTEQLIAISNNYVAFNEQVEEFYNQKFIELKENTKKCYDQLQNQYREISMVIIDRLVLPLKIQFKILFDKQKFFQCQMEKAYSMIIDSQIWKNMSKVHFIFKKRYFQRIFSTIRQEICKMLEKEVDLLKKKKDIGRVVERINKYKVDCLEMAELLVKQKLKIDRELNEIITLLTTQRRDQIAFIMTEASDLFKRIYKKITTLREDYSSLSTIMKTNEIDSPLKGKGLTVDINLDDLEERKSFSRYYIQDYDRSSIEASSEKIDAPLSLEQPSVKMIAEGFVYRNKFNSGTYEKIFLKLKKSVLYLYENDKTERCQNTVQIQDIVEVKVPLPDRPYFTIFHKGLQRVRELQLRCQTIEQRMSWVYSVESQQRRLKNDMKMKVIKMKQLTCTLIIDYDQLQHGRDYFSYSND